MSFKLPASRDELAGLVGLDLALYWAGLGFPVYPLVPHSRAAFFKEWPKKATTNETLIRGWWGEWQHAWVGLKTGAACGCGCQDGPDVLDVDHKNGASPGMATFEMLLDRGVLVPDSFLVSETKTGGRHLIGLPTPGERSWANKFAGVDARAHHGQIPVPGTPGYVLKRIPSGLGVMPLGTCLAVLAPTTGPAGPSRPSDGLGRPGTPRPLPAAPRASPEGKLVAPALGEKVGKQAPREQVLARIQQLADQIAAAGEGEGNHTASRLACEAGNYVGEPGNGVSRAEAEAVLLGALDSWSFNATSPRSSNENTIRRQLEFGMGSPRMWRDGTPKRTTEPAASEPAGLPVPVTETPEAVLRFWGRRPVLRDIAWLARERRVSPWAALGAVLAMTACRIGPHVVLPPIIGGVASLNVLVGLVGRSGLGKGAATAVALDFLDMRGRFMVEEAGTGQGIESAFTETPAKGSPVQFNDVALFEVPEVDTLLAHSQQAGSTLLAVLRKAYSGERLGPRYASKDRRRPVSPHCYRAAVLCGIQPARSGALLDDVDGGTPQRWLWLPTNDPDRYKGKLVAPSYSGRPPVIEMDGFIPSGELRSEKGEPEQVEVQPRIEIPLCRSAEDATVGLRENGLDSDLAGLSGGSLDGHTNLTRLKVAALLGFLDRRCEVTEEDWELSGLVMWVSNQTRAVCQRALQEADRATNRKRGEGRAHAALAEDATRAVLLSERQIRVAELAEKAVSKLREARGEWYAPTQLLKDAMNGPDRKEHGSAVHAAVRAYPGVVEGEEQTSGQYKIRKLRWAGTNTA